MREDESGQFSIGVVPVDLSLFTIGMSDVWIWTYDVGRLTLVVRLDEEQNSNPIGLLANPVTVPRWSNTTSQSDIDAAKPLVSTHSSCSNLTRSEVLKLTG